MLPESRAESNKLCSQTTFPSFPTEEKCFFPRPLNGEDSSIILDLGLFSSWQLHVQSVSIYVWTFCGGCLESSFFFCLGTLGRSFVMSLWFHSFHKHFNEFLPEAGSTEFTRSQVRRFTEGLACFWSSCPWALFPQTYPMVFNVLFSVCKFLEHT